jgi:hypothetical protein
MESNSAYEFGPSSADEIGNLERRRGHGSNLLLNRDPHLYQNRLAITAPLAHAKPSAAGRLRPNAAPIEIDFSPPEKTVF